jgi:hypothetical protein
MGLLRHSPQASAAVVIFAEFEEHLTKGGRVTRKDRKSTARDRGSNQAAQFLV